jgi:hypothetical protein
MRITESEIRRIIREEITPAPPRSALNKFAFAEQRPEEFEDPEKNNEKENKLLRSILDHFLDGGDGLTANDCSLIQKFLKKGIYSDVFFPPTVKTVKRGMTVSESYLRSMKVFNIWSGLESGGFAVVKHPQHWTYNPLQGKSASSWSKAVLTDPSDGGVVWSFAFGNTWYGDRGHKAGVIFVAETAANPGMFFDADGVYGLEGMTDSLADEEEAVGLGSIICRSLIVVKH